jgi:hypothetical protein
MGLVADKNYITSNAVEVIMAKARKEWGASLFTPSSFSRAWRQGNAWVELSTATVCCWHSKGAHYATVCFARAVTCPGKGQAAAV